MINPFKFPTAICISRTRASFVAQAICGVMKQLGYGKDYKYAHAYQGNFVQQQFLPDEVKGSRIWHPQNNAQEAKIKERMQSLWGERFKE